MNSIKKAIQRDLKGEIIIHQKRKIMVQLILSQLQQERQREMK